MRLSFLSLCLFCLALLSGGCASIISDDESTTYIETIPECAECTLHGQDFKRKITTPDSIHLPSEAAPITISCKAEGYRTTSEVMDTKMDGWIFGNIIFGGIIGAVVDAGRGAGQKFPPKFTVQLDPVSFRTAQLRDEYYKERSDTLAARYDSLIRKAETRYKSDNDQSRLERAVAKLEKEKADKLDELERRRISSILIEQGPPPDGTETSEAPAPEPAG